MNSNSNISLTAANKFFSDVELNLLLEKDVIQSLSYDGQDFVRLTQDYKKLPRGTVFYDEGIVPGYPHIMRILHLERGISRYLKTSRFFIEEKMDGYNVRVVRIKNKILALTRGGFVCPFTTDRIPDLIDSRFFDRYPNYILCGEVVGPGSPYNTEVIPYVDNDIAFFVFDIIKDDRNLLPPDERIDVLKEFNMKGVDQWGPFDITDLGKIKEIILELNRKEREGIVIKPINSRKVLKFVTISSCLRDLKATTHLITEIPAGFYMQRIIRALFFSYEFGTSISDDYLMEAARSLYHRPYEAIKDVAEGGEIKETFDVKIRKRQTADELLRHLNRSGVYTQLLSLERAGDFYRLRFNRVYRKGTKEIRQLLKGKGFFD